MHRHFWPTLSIAWLKVCHSTWRVLVTDLRQHGASVLRSRLFVFLLSIWHLWCSRRHLLNILSSWFRRSLSRNPNWRSSSSVTRWYLRLSRFPWNFYLVEAFWTVVIAITLFLVDLLILQNTLSQKHFRICSFSRWLIVQYLIFGSRSQFAIALVVELWIGRIPMLL